jgi:hypothetical protein
MTPRRAREARKTAGARAAPTSRALVGRVLAVRDGDAPAVRTHPSLNKDAPIHRPIHQFGRIVSVPVLGGPHHQYCPT